MTQATYMSDISKLLSMSLVGLKCVIIVVKGVKSCFLSEKQEKEKQAQDEKNIQNNQK